MPDCKACGAWFGSVTPQDLCPACERALARLKGYAVPVVRCKECRHHSADAGVCNLYLHFSVGVSANDFCSFGERKNG